MHRLFVYGTLRSEVGHSAHKYISSCFSFAGVAVVKGKLYDLGEYPGAVPSNEDVFVTGELYEISDEAVFSRAIAQLDEYEGLDEENSKTALFRREVVTVFINGNTINA